jgi:hypothetical protein
MNKYDKKHLSNVDKYQRQIDTIYKTAIKEASKIAGVVKNFDSNKLLSFDDYPETKKLVDNLLNDMASSLNVAIVNGVQSEWTLANNKNNELSRQVFGDKIKELSAKQYKKYVTNNDKALEAFKERKENGLNLSDRVWNYTDQFKDEIELALDLGIGDGVSAAEIARDLKQYLKHPDMLFRRVRDKHGNLVLSQRAKNYHPGRGVYRSSYKNARRLAATETNMAYRTADYERWSDMDFVVGIEVKLSNNHNCKGVQPGLYSDICDELKGKYPKDFKFVGWHPHCRCHAEPILKTADEFLADDERIAEGKEPTNTSENEVRDTPQVFKDWIEDNKERIESAKSLPYFIKDNKELVNRITEEPKNGRSALLEQIASGIGAEYGSPMTFQEANEMRANPNYKRGGMYQTNCQSSVVANELRRRGLDVEAYGNSKAEWYMPYELGKRPEAAWLTTDGEIPTPSVIQGEINAKAFADSMTKEGRYQLWFKWEGKDSGHVITAERLADGTLRYYDAQSGKSAFEFLFSFDDIESGVNVLRLNDLNPNDKIIGGIVKAAKSKAKAPRMTMEQISWWLENAQGATSYGGINKEMLSTTKEIRRNRERFKTSEIIEAKNLQTGALKRTGEPRRNLIDHLYSLEESNAAEYAWNNPTVLRFVERSELGEVKDMTKLSAQKNIKKKINRHVTHYNLYEFDYNGKTWNVKLESLENGTEQFYCMVKTKNS